MKEPSSMDYRENLLHFARSAVDHAFGTNVFSSSRFPNATSDLPPTQPFDESGENVPGKRVPR
jgi:hypothetical protein